MIISLLCACLYLPYSNTWVLTAHAGCLVNSSIIHLKRIKTKLYEAVLVTGLILVCIKGSLRKLLFVSVPHWKTYRLGWCPLWKDNSWAQILCPCESDSALLTDMTPQSENEPTELKQPALIRRRELGLLTLTVFHLPTPAAGLGRGAKMWFFKKKRSTHKRWNRAMTFSRDFLSIHRWVP